MEQYVLSLDQGTTSSRAILFAADGGVVGKAQQNYPQYYPQPGWVEHDASEIWHSQCAVAAQVLANSGAGADIAAIGITNQRETTILWDRATGEPVCRAIVWQCRRTAAICDALREQPGVKKMIADKTGLLLDAYFSGTKLQWMLNNVPHARERAERGELLFGTVESWLIWKLTGEHVTDYSNASRTMLFNIQTLAWDPELCTLLSIPMTILPRPVSNSEIYGWVRPGIKGLEELAGVPVCGAAGDQQSALFGQGCFTSGEAKNTYGTGCFTLMNTGTTVVRSHTGLVSSVGWSIGGRTTYVLEGSVFNAGSTIQWLRDELKLIDSARECDELAETVSDTGGVYLVPAFTGLGAPYWDMYARGTITGITRGTGRAHIARAVLESIAFEVTDLMNAMNQDAPCPISVLRVDGGASVSNLMMQLQSDLLRIPVDRPAMVETTAFGAAALAGLAVGVWKDTDELRALRRCERVFFPAREQAVCEEQYRQWKRAVHRSLGWAEKD